MMGKEKNIASPVRINITNLHLAKANVSPDNQVTFEKPERIIGAEQVSRKPEISSGKLYGDGIVRFKTSKKTGYEIEINCNNLPAEWRSYIEGTTISESGVESASSKDEPKPFAAGWEVQKTGGKSEFIWFLFCLGEPIEVTTQQSEDNTNYSRDSIKILAMEHTQFNRFYTFVDTALDANKSVTTETFFAKVQTTDTIGE